jgi:hypothetical protein
MSSVLYSTICYNKNDLYRLSICIDDNQQSLNNIQCDTDSSDFISSEISIDNIIPSLTRINLQLINDRKNTNISKTIILNHLLSVQQTQIIPNRNRKYFNNNTNEFTYTNDTISTTELSQKASQTTLNTTISETVIPQTPTSSRQFDFRGLFSTQSCTDGQVNLLSKIGVNINYVDILNSIRWSIKTLKLEFKTEDIANELYVNLNICLSALTQRPRHLLAFVNPFGGKGKKSKFLFDTSIKTIFLNSYIRLIYDFLN